MSNVLIGIIGVILFIGLALAGALFLGPRFSNSRTESEAARLMQGGSQISKAYELYRLNEGGYPDGSGFTGDANQRKLQQMKSKGYLKEIPQGGQTSGSATPWYIDDEKGAALTLIGTDAGALNVCEAARKQVGLTDAIKDCGASDITNIDPCCKAP